MCTETNTREDLYPTILTKRPESNVLFEGVLDTIKIARVSLWIMNGSFKGTK